MRFLLLTAVALAATHGALAAPVPLGAHHSGGGSGVSRPLSHNGGADASPPQGPSTGAPTHAPAHAHAQAPLSAHAHAHAQPDLESHGRAAALDGVEASPAREQPFFPNDRHAMAKHGAALVVAAGAAGAAGYWVYKNYYSFDGGSPTPGPMDPGPRFHGP